jgi:hypothetical protein
VEARPERRGDVWQPVTSHQRCRPARAGGLERGMTNTLARDIELLANERIAIAQHKLMRIRMRYATLRVATDTWRILWG